MRHAKWSRLLLSLLVVLAMFATACGSDAVDSATDAVTDAVDGDDTADESEEEPEPEPTDVPEPEPTDVPEPEPEDDGDAMAAGSDDPADAAFVSLQFAPVEEAEKFRDILSGGGIDVTIGEEGPTIDQILAGAGAVDVLGALHGTFPPLGREGAMTNMVDVLDDLSADREIAPAFVQSGLLGTDDFLHYVPWAQATYIMAANNDALEYLPAGADVQAITWQEFADWCKNIQEGEGTQKCGLPKAGLFHRFLEGYLFPSFTGGMASQFRSTEAADMMEWMRDELWPTMHPESINYEFMQEPLQSGEVWVAFDHTARLIDAFESDPDQFIGFPAPAGPAGRGFMPVILGLGIPADAPNPEAGAAVIDYLTSAEVQGEVLAELGFYPVVDGVDFSNLPAGVQIEADTVAAQANAPDALPALLPVGLGDRGGEINEIFKAAFDRIVLDGEDPATALDEEGDNLQTLFDETGAPCWDPDPIADGPCVVAAGGGSAGVGAGAAAAALAPALGPAADASFVSLQFAPVEEAEKFRSILGDIDLTIGEEGPTIDQILAGSESIDVLGALHGTFPPLGREGALTNMVDVLDDLSADREIAPAFVQSGLLGTDDFLHYVPWAQATYIMAANTDALEYLPAGADVQAITWEELAEWCQAMQDGEGTQKCGLPKAGLFHRFLEGYLFPSFTGGMASEFRSAEAVEMMEWTRDTLWPTMHPESINYEFMQEPLLSGDVWVAFDHTARLIDAFESDPDQFIGFPAPAGPAGRGFMPVILGLGIPADAPDPKAGEAVIEYLTRPEVQGEVLSQLGFYPVVDGVDFSNLPAGVQIEADTVLAQAASPDALPALLPVGLGDRGGEINEIFKAAFDRIVIDGEDPATALDAEGDNLQTLFDETGAPCWDPDPITDGPCIVKAAG